MKTHRVAIYSSVLYGEDFIVESINSILPLVDHVFVVMMDRPWGGTNGVLYEETWVSWPATFDHTRERILEMKDSRIEIIESSKFSPWNRWGHALSLIHSSIDEVIFLDPDCVFSDSEAQSVLDEWNTSDCLWAQPGQIELWKTPAWQVVRPRSMVSLHRGNLSLLQYPDPPREDGIVRPPIHVLSGKAHNLGFCVSVENMRWKHLTSMAFSPIIGDSVPNPRWYKDKWLNWTPETRNLEISLGSEDSIPCAIPYDPVGLPESIKKRVWL